MGDYSQNPTPAIFTAMGTVGGGGKYGIKYYQNTGTTLTLLEAKNG
ncbi:MAG: hypothetical protein H0A76_05730 [Candidatus Thiodubiliella endoseptemdiera]|uniref:Uncharacterized protein n=1 Tax=Candidatus Thiodubiliella endoseptemdiera TaxID=2738886 RepID=A0A853F1P2_9GAMM|nr:hypothetical protein [Candidatus Thiodubiliella endoseptemdiera]